MNKLEFLLGTAKKKKNTGTATGHLLHSICKDMIMLNSLLADGVNAAQQIRDKICVVFDVCVKDITMYRFGMF